MQILSSFQICYQVFFYLLFNLHSFLEQKFHLTKNRALNIRCLFHEKYQKPKILQGFLLNLQNSGNSHEFYFNLKKNFFV